MPEKMISVPRSETPEHLTIDFKELALPEEDKKLIQEACVDIYRTLLQVSVWVERLPTRFEIVSLEDEGGKLTCEIIIEFYMGHPHWRQKFVLEDGSFTVSDEVKEDLKKECGKYDELDNIKSGKQASVSWFSGI